MPLTKPTGVNPVRAAILIGGALLGNRLTNDGPLVQRLESEAATYLGVKHFVAMSSGTLALECAMGLFAGNGSEVVIPSFAFPAVAQAVMRVGGVPVFCDIGRSTWTLDPECVSELVEQDKGIDLVVPVTTLGITPSAKFFSTRKGTPLVFDRAEEEWGPTSVRGKVDVFSMHATKPVFAGEGGAIATESNELANFARYWRNFGFVDGKCLLEGTNAKMPEVSAVIGLLSLASWPKRKRQLHERRVRYMETMRGMGLWNRYRVSLSNNYCVVLFRDAVERCGVANRLAQEGIATRAYFDPLHKMLLFNGGRKIDLPITESIAGRTLALPLWADMPMRNIDRICALLSEVVR